MTTIIKNSQIVLPIGAKVIAIDFTLEVMLAETDRDFVTWQFNPSTMSCFWGHYFPKFASSDPFLDARIDYYKRVNALASSEFKQAYDAA